MQIAQWMTKTFEVSTDVVNSFEKFGLGIEIETKSKTKSKQEYVVRKKTKARTIDIDIALNAMLGVDVEAEVLSWAELANAGKGGKFYIGGRAMAPCDLIATSVKATETTFAPSGLMLSAKVAISFKQASKNDKVTKNNRASQVISAFYTAKSASRALKKI